MTTSYWRTYAMDLEARLEWERAALAWQSAINNYPWPNGELAATDLARMAERRDYCTIAAEAARSKP